MPVESLASFVLALTRPAAGDKGDGAAEAAGEAAGEAAAAHEGAALGLCCETLRAPAGMGELDARDAPAVLPPRPRGVPCCMHPPPSQPLPDCSQPLPECVT